MDELPPGSQWDILMETLLADKSYLKVENFQYHSELSTIDFLDQSPIVRWVFVLKLIETVLLNKPTPVWALSWSTALCKPIGCQPRMSHVNEQQAFQHTIGILGTIITITTLIRIIWLRITSRKLFSMLRAKALSLHTPMPIEPPLYAENWNSPMWVEDSVANRVNEEIMDFNSAGRLLGLWTRHKIQLSQR